MSDSEERPGKSEVNTNTQTPDSDTTNVIRYSKDVLLSLHDSPLVCTPENMPPLSSWFGEEAGSPTVAKNILNSSVVSRSTDKSIILGPSKTNFASSLYGGLKHTTDSRENTTSSTTKSSSNSSRLRQSEDSIRTHTNSNNNRLSRGSNYVGEKGFHYHHHNSRQDKGSNSLDRRTSNNYGNNKRYNQHHHHPHHYSDHQATDRQTMNLSAGGRKDYNRDQRASNRLSQANYNDGHERVPEWMDYNPDTKTTTDVNDKPAMNNDYANDLEAWKSSMKKKEGRDDAADKLPTKQDTTNDSTSLDKILDLGSLELNPPSSSTDKIASPVSALFDSSSTPQSSETSSKRGSRFAKFFAKREEATLASPPISSPLASVGNATNDTAQTRSISVSDLFQKPDVSSQQQTGINTVNLPNQKSNLTRHDTNTPPPSNIRMLSEDDVLQSLGAKKVTVSSPELSSPDSNANAIGFNKVLQILSQPKPTVPSSTTHSHDTNINLPRNINSPQKSQQNGTVTDVSSTPSSPVVARQQSHPNSEMKSTSTAPRELPTSDTAAKHKKVSNLFGNNLPTSVLRKMSARSDTRSPSLSSNKSGQSGRFNHSTSDSRNGSPLIGNVSSPSPSMTATQQQYHHQQPAHSPSNNHGYHGYSFSTATTTTASTTTAATINGNNTQSPQFHHHDISHGVPSTTARPRINEMMMMNPQQAPRNQPSNGYDTMMQQQMYGNATETTGMPPPHHRGLPPTIQPSGSPGMNTPMNRMMSHQFMQQQQQQQQQQHQQQQLGSIMDPSFISHPPPPPPPPQQMMGMPGMMPPPHLQMHPQGQGRNTGNAVPPPPPPPFMQPMMPRMPAPAPLPMGMSQQMYASKNQGWNRQ